MKRRGGAIGLGAVLACSVLLLACDGLTARRLSGTWESAALPKRTLVLASDGTYSRRLSGKTLGVVSDIFGPERGAWRVERGVLVLVQHGVPGERSETLKIDDVSPRKLILAGEAWKRVEAPGAVPP